MGNALKADSLDAALDLLDRQVQDVDGHPLGKVDDLLFTDVSPGGEPPQLVALLIGHRALGHRFGGRVGRWWHAAAAWISRTEGPVEVPLEKVADIGVVVRLDLHREELPELLVAERWLRQSFIGRIPGADRDRG